MSLHEIRQEVLDDHRALARELDAVEQLCAALAAGDPGAAISLRDGARALYARFAAHLVLEDRILVPYLHATTGRTSAELLSSEHREQRELLAYLIGRLSQPGRPDLLLARELREFAALLRAEMQREEAALEAASAARPSA